MLSEVTLAFGRDVMSALLGLDALYRRESSDGEGLAVVNLDIDGRHSADPFSTYAEACSRFEDLRVRARSLPERDRRAYYDALCHSSLAFVAWRSSGLSFVDQIQDFLHVPAAPASTAELDSLREEMSVVLDRLSYRGRLKDQCAAWEEKNRVEPKDVPRVLENLLDEAWTRTESKLFQIPRPRSDGMRVVPVSGVAFNARCNYLERRIELNVDPILTRPGLKHLAVHEGYPGHYVQFTLRTDMEKAGEACADVLLSVVNTASSSIFEGIGDTGIELLDWFESDDDRFQALMNRYRAGIGTVAAWQLHAQGWSEDRVRESLMHASLVGGDGWAENRVKFVRSPARAVLIWSYWWGERVVQDAWRRVAPRDRSRFLKFMHGRMHSNESLGMFE